MTSKKFSMFLDSISGVTDKIVLPVTRVCNWISSALICLMAIITVVDVAARSFFNSPFPGVIELEEYMLVGVVFLSIAYTATRNGHIKVDIISRKYSPVTSLVVSSISSMVFMCFLCIIGWYQITKGVESFQIGEAAVITGIPEYPFMFLITFGCAMMVLVEFNKLIKYQAAQFKISGRPWLRFVITLLAGIVIILIPGILKSLPIELSPSGIALIAMILLFIFLFAGIPIAASIGFAGIIGIWYQQGFEGTGFVVQMNVYPSVSGYLFTIIPLFIGMGFLALAARFSENLYSSIYRIVGGVRGSLAMSTVIGSACFAAISGDSMATSATMGSVALPEMRKRDYRATMATGCLAAGGTLGILIPPSIGFIVYAIITEQSVGKLFMGGIIPGIILALLFCAVIYIQCLLDPTAGPPGEKTDVIDKIKAIKPLWPILSLAVIVMGGIYSGIFTPTEAGSIGFFFVLIIGLIMKRFTIKSFIGALFQTTEVTAMIFTAVIGVNIFNFLIASTNLTSHLVEIISGLVLSPYLVIGAVIIMYIILGCVMSILAMMMLTLPMIFPVITSLGFDPIWFGVIMVIVMEMGMITPPIGINVFVISSIAKDIPMARIFKGTLPFVFAMLVVIVILILFPDIALILPDSMETLAPIDID